MIVLSPLVYMGYALSPGALTHVPTSAGRFVPAPATITPPLPEIVDSVPGAELAAEELSEVTLEVLVGEPELLSTEDVVVGADDELDDTDDVVVCVETVDIELTALDVVVAAGSELPQPVTRTAAAMAVASNADLDASMHFMVLMVAADRSRRAGFARTRALWCRGVVGS